MVPLHLDLRPMQNSPVGAKGRFKFQTTGFGVQGGQAASSGDQVIDSYIVESEPNQDT